MEVKGTIKVIFETVQVSEKFKKRDVVISTQEQYSQDISIQFVQDKTSILDKYKVGQSVTVGININGRSWKSPQGEVKYFNTINGWRIDAEQSQAPKQAPPAQPQTTPLAPLADDDDGFVF